jgi:pimeloyl-ACP methyl ester carboxylesterase
MLPEPAELLGASAGGIRGFADTLRDLSGTAFGRALVDSAIRAFADDSVETLKSDPNVVARAAHELALTDLTPELPRIRAPLTVLYASPDPDLGAAADSVYREAYAGDPSARLVRIDGSGHMIMAEQPRRFAQELKVFLAAN